MNEFLQDHELPSQTGYQRLVDAVSFKLADPKVQAESGDFPNVVLQARYHQYDRLHLISYADLNVRSPKDGVAVCMAIFYESANGKWPRSGGSIYEVYMDEDGQLHTDFSYRRPIKEEMGDSDDMVAYLELLDAQAQEAKDLGYNIVGKAELEAAIVAIEAAKALEPELPQESKRSILSLRQLGKRVLAAINRERREEKD